MNKILEQQKHRAIAIKVHTEIILRFVAKRFV